MTPLTPADWAEVEWIRDWTQRFALKLVGFHADSMRLLLRALDELTAERDALLELTRCPDDPSRAIERMFSKMDAEDKKAFNFCLISARGRQDHGAVAEAINDDLDLIEMGHLDLVRVVRERLKGFIPGAPHDD